MILLHDFDEKKFKKVYEKLHQMFEKYIRFLPEDDEIFDNVAKMSHPERVELAKTISHNLPSDPQNYKWIWTGTWTGTPKQPTYKSKNVIRLLYRELIDTGITPTRRLTVFTSPIIGDVNPYCVGISITPKGCGRLTHNARRASDSQLAQQLSTLVKPDEVTDGFLPDPASQPYKEALSTLEDSGFIELGLSFRDEAKRYLMDAGVEIKLCNYLINKHIPILGD